jgi:hypothetical protein
MSKAQWDVWDSSFVLTLTGPTGRVARLRLRLGEVLMLLRVLMRFPNPNVVPWVIEVFLRDVAPLRAGLTSSPLHPIAEAGRGGSHEAGEISDEALARLVIRTLAPAPRIRQRRKRSLGSAVGAFLNGVLAAVGLRRRRAANGSES